jgi:molybdate transport system substrate-binding protein
MWGESGYNSDSTGQYRFYEAGDGAGNSLLESGAMRIGFGKLMAASAVVVAVLIGVLMFREPSPPSSSGAAPAGSPATLLLYCAAGLQPPVNEIMSAYEASHHVHIELQVAGSGSLLSQIMLGGGDVFLAADRLYLDQASQKHLAPLIIPIAYQFPVILVRKGNPKGITGLNDLLNPDVRLSLADPQRAAIGKVVRGLLEKDDRWEALWKKAVTHRETVNEVGTDVKLVAADAGIVWNTTAAQLPDLQVIHVPEFDHSKNEIAVGLLSSSKDPQVAHDFIHYLSDPDQGLRVFTRFGYEVVGTKPPAAR